MLRYILCMNPLIEDFNKLKEIDVTNKSLQYCKTLQDTFLDIRLSISRGEIKEVSTKEVDDVLRMINTVIGGGNKIVEELEDMDY